MVSSLIEIIECEKKTIKVFLINVFCFDSQVIIALASAYPQFGGNPFLQNQRPQQQGQGPFFGNQGFQNQGFPNQGFQNQGFPSQGFPNQGFQGQGSQNQGFPNQNTQNQGFPNQGFSNQAGQNQGFPNQGLGNQAGQNQGFPSQGFLNQGGQNQGFRPNPNNPFFQNPSQSQGNFGNFNPGSTEGTLAEFTQQQPGQNGQNQQQNQQQGQQNPTQQTPGSSTTPGAAPAQSPQFIACLRNCQTTSEYNPVCGTDQTAYPNIRRLECANRCGQQLDPNWQGN